MPVANGSDAVYAIDNEGRRWIKKVLIGANDLLAESVGFLLCDVLRIPAPRGAVCGSGEETTWLSEYLGSTAHWEPSRAQSLKNPEDLGAMIALDAIIGNWDRHAGNLLLLPDETPDQLRVFSIDLASSWIGTPSDIASRGLEVPDVEKLASGIEVDLIRDGAENCAKEAAKLPHQQLHEFAQEACTISGSKQVQIISEALRLRCEQAPRLISEYLQKIEKRS